MMARFLPPLLCLFLAATSARAETLEELLARMDKAASSFTGMTGALKQVDHTEVLGENEVQTAAVKLKKGRSGPVGRLDFAEPNRRIVGLSQRTVEIYTPKSNTVQVYDLGKFGQQLDQFLVLGFATSGKELQKNYHVKFIGQENVGERKATHIELTPKSKDAQQYFRKADMWMAQDAPYPLQEKIHKNAQDYILITYTDVKLNVPLADQELELKLPAGVNRIYPNK